MRGSPTCELVFENLEIPEENILGEINKGVYILMSGLDYERLVLSAGPVGLMQNALDVTVDYCKQRQQFGKPIGEFQLMQGKLADMYMSVQSTRAFLYSMSRNADEGITSNTVGLANEGLRLPFHVQLRVRSQCSDGGYTGAGRQRIHQ